MRELLPNFGLSILGVLVVVLLPPLLAYVTRLVGTIFLASRLMLLAFCFIVFMLVYVLTQVTIVSNCLAVVVQELAIQKAKETARNTKQLEVQGNDRAKHDGTSLTWGAHDPEGTRTGDHLKIDTLSMASAISVAYT